MKFIVLVKIENKPYIDDPEGDTILRDLIARGGYVNIESVRCAKTLKLVVRASSEKSARQITQKLCDDLRIYNPTVSNCYIESGGRTK